MKKKSLNTQQRLRTDETFTIEVKQFHKNKKITLFLTKFMKLF